MSSLLFKKSKIECPRCIGKGHVDINDIKRLNKELYWLPGKCAYCNGKGKVNPGLISKVSPDSSYYTVSLSKDERRRIKQKDQFALERANNYNKQVENFIKQIELEKNFCFYSAIKFSIE